jgi:hypothetical protein
MNEIFCSIVPPVRGLEKEEPELAEELDIPTDEDSSAAASAAASADEDPGDIPRQ